MELFKEDLHDEEYYQQFDRHYDNLLDVYTGNTKALQASRSFFLPQLEAVRVKYNITIPQNETVAGFVEEWSNIKSKCANYKSIKDVSTLEMLNSDIDYMHIKINKYCSSFLIPQHSADVVRSFIDDGLVSELEMFKQTHEYMAKPQVNPVTGQLETEQEVDARIIKYVKETWNKDLSTEPPVQEFIEYYNFFKELETLQNLFIEMMNLRNNISQQIFDLKWEEFKNDKEFMADLIDIMEHDEEEFEYRYHGTQCIEDAESILNEGLLMKDPDLNSTSYPEFSPQQVCMYERGGVSLAGREAIVIFKVPKRNGRLENIVKKNKNKNLTFCPSGSSGLEGQPNYIIPKEYIVGYVNKRDHKVVHGLGYTNNAGIQV